MLKIKNILAKSRVISALFNFKARGLKLGNMFTNSFIALNRCPRSILAKALEFTFISKNPIYIDYSDLKENYYYISYRR